MCLFPRLIRNPTKRLSRHGGQPLFLEVPCNSCSECKDSKRHEWHFRSFHEVNNIIQHGGYVVYDTLTYAEEHVPHLSNFIDIEEYGLQDFYCFNSEHWRNFLKRIRRHLSYHFPTVQLRYFLTSEYGTDDRYTHRPHYHILFFLNNKDIDPITFSKLVSKLWTYGRTDGIVYHDAKYFSENVFGYDLGFGANSDLLKVCNYITKYITKDSTYQSILDNRIQIINKKVDDEEIVSKLTSTINQYHRQSQGFGISYLNTLDSWSYDRIFKDNVCLLMDKEDITLTIPLPLYYKRKLFYRTVKDEEGSIQWIPTDEGKRYLEYSLLHRIDSQQKRYETMFANLKSDEQHLISDLFHDNSFYNLAVYSVCYRNRMHSGKLEDDVNVWIDKIISSTFNHTSTDIDTFERDVENNTIAIPQNLGTLFTKPLYYNYDYTKFIKQHRITQDSSSYFMNMDIIISLFDYSQKDIKKGQQNLFEYFEQLTKKFKILYGKS